MKVKQHFIKFNNPPTAFLVDRQEKLLLIYNTRQVRDDDSSIVQTAKLAIHPNAHLQEHR